MARENLGTYSTRGCFSGPGFRYGAVINPRRLAHFPAELPVLPDGHPKRSFVWPGQTSLKEVIAEELGVSVRNQQEVEVAEGHLVRLEKCFSLQQIEKTVTLYSRGDNSFGLRGDGKQNHFFVDRGDKRVEVVSIHHEEARMSMGGWLEAGWDVWTLGLVMTDISEFDFVFFRN